MVLRDSFQVQGVKTTKWPFQRRDSLFADVNAARRQAGKEACSQGKGPNHNGKARGVQSL